MKIQCDVCAAEEATVFCTADEAALCKSCDHKVHQANKLAKKHSRFSLLHPSSDDSPLCDICQEKRAFLFCREDRAILCRECDSSIHQVNELAQMHNRYLLTGVKLSTNSSMYQQFSTSPSSSAACQDSKLKAKSSKSAARNSRGTDQRVMVQMSESSSYTNNSTTSISGYLESLSGWHVEDYFDPLNNHYAYC